MALTTLEVLQQAWPGRLALRADEVAHVLRGKSTKRVVERVRGKMKDGSYGSGARKIDGVWQLPLTDLAEVIDPSPHAPTLPNPERLPQKRSRRRSAIGPRVRFVQQARFWASVLAVLGDQEAQPIADEANAILSALRDNFRVGRAARSKAALVEELRVQLGQAPKKPRKTRRPHRPL